MNKCTDIEKRLSSYLEGDANLPERKLIMEHLENCKQCSDSLEGLKKTTELLQNLEEIEPPPWMKQRIMARVREEAEEKKGIFRKLFFPLHIKIPIEVFATCLVVVMALYVFKSAGPEIKFIQVPSEQAQTADYPDKQYNKVLPAPAPVSKGKTEHVEHYEKDAVAASSIEKGGSGITIPGGVSVSPPPAVMSAPAMSDSVGTVPARIVKERGIEEKREIFRSPPSLAAAPELVHKKKEDITAHDEEMQRRFELKSAPNEPRLKAFAAKKRQTVNITLKSDDIFTAVREIEGFLNRVGAVDFKRDSPENAEIITATFPAQALKEFIEKLKNVGEVKERIMLYNIPEEEIAVRIKIVNNW